MSIIMRSLMKILIKLRGNAPKTADELRRYGAIIGKNFTNYARIDLGHANLLTIGDNVILSDCRILLHDASTKISLGYSKIGRVTIGSNVFIGADAIVLPNVVIGSNCIVGAGSIVTKNVPDNSVVAGNPAKVICSYESYIKKNKELMKNSFVYNTYWKDKTRAEKIQQYNDLCNGDIGFDI